MAIFLCRQLQSASVFPEDNCLRTEYIFLQCSWQREFKSASEEKTTFRNTFPSTMGIGDHKTRQRAL